MPGIALKIILSAKGWGNIKSSKTLCCKHANNMKTDVPYRSVTQTPQQQYSNPVNGKVLRIAVRM